MAQKSSKLVRPREATTWNPCPLTSPDKRLLVLDLILVIIWGRLCSWPRLDGCRRRPGN